jgi:5-methylcytosine-specific restriction endonuclease McrA
MLCLSRARFRCAFCGRPATEVHHIDGLGPRGPRGLDQKNLLASCKSCHTRAHAETLAAARERVGAHWPPER